MPGINDYAPIVGRGTIDDLYLLAEKLQDKKIRNINSTASGGGVAEILARMLPLLQEIGVDAHWDVITGDNKFFGITKKIHNALHGVPTDFEEGDFDYLVEVNRRNLQEMELDADVMFIHDPQPIALIEKRDEMNAKWAWRCHIDITQPDPKVMGFLEQYIKRYEAAILSASRFSRDLPVPQFLISPSIDPLSDKNRELEPEKIDNILEKYGLDKSRPIVTQISRFDRLKDPVGVLKVYKKVKKRIDCQLVLAGGGAIDDPEGLAVLEEVKEEAEDDPDIHILFLPPGSNIEINALQRGSTVIMQKSLKEGFGLTVSEALWKGKPVIASAVGGIPLQMKHQYSGILTHSIEGTAYYLKQLLNEPDYARELGIRGKEHVRNNFLITRHIRDYLLLFLYMEHKKELIAL